MASTSEWMHFHQNPPSAGQVAAPRTATSASDLLFWTTSASTVVSTSPAAAINPPPGPGQAQMGPVGRVSKPARRRTRASRRTPTTLLNTDTANFRAMVQQFTGGPAFSSPTVGGDGSLGVLGLLGPGRAQIVPGPGPGFGFLGPNQALRYAMSNNNNSSTNLQGMGDVFMNGDGGGNRGSNNGGFQF